MSIDTDGTTDTTSNGIFDKTFRRKLVTIYKLYSLKVDTKVPRIVVIGSQSVGKSSLIESIAKISLPRKEGTCTRCPIECYLIHSDDKIGWRCEVTLHYKEGLVRPPVSFGGLITNPLEVQNRIEKAQRAVLNSELDPQIFLQNDLPEKDVRRFTQNYVSLKIQGPDLIDLIFCDLPGIIETSVDQSDSEEVKHLVHEYIKDEEAIILCTTTCETDFENQPAFPYAQKHDPEGNRTIGRYHVKIKQYAKSPSGVLTKPDRIGPGTISSWLPILRNEKYTLKHGWYCVKQRNKVDLDANMTFDEARIAGEEYFKVPPWSELDFEPTFRASLGTQALINKLQKCLFDRLNKRLPEILKEIGDRLYKVQQELDRIPPQPRDPLTELNYMVQEYCEDVYNLAQGMTYIAQPTQDRFNFNQFRKIRNAHEEFREAVRRTTPNFLPYDREPRTSEGVTSDPSFLLQEEKSLYVSLPSSPLYLNNVTERVNDAQKRELPGYFPFQVVQDLITIFILQWKNPALKLLEEIHEIVRAHNKSLVTTHFEKYYSAKQLPERITMIMEEYAQQQRKRATERVEWLLELEKTAFTLNLHYYEDYRKKFLTFYRNERSRHLLANGSQRPQQSFEPWSSVETAIEIMATVRAYFQVSFKRVVDILPLAIDRELIRIDRRDLQEAIKNGLRINDYSTAAHLVAEEILTESSTVKRKREDFVRLVGTLTEARDEVLNSINTTFNTT